MTINEMRECIGKRVIVSDLRGFGFRFYQCQIARC